MEEDPYASPTEFDLALQQERDRTLTEAATGSAADLLSPRRVRRVYTPLQPAGVGTGGTPLRRTADSDILQDALSQADIDLDPFTISPLGPAGLGSPSILSAIRTSSPIRAVRLGGVGVPSRPRRPNPSPARDPNIPSPSQLPSPLTATRRREERRRERGRTTTTTATTTTTGGRGRTPRRRRTPRRSPRPAPDAATAASPRGPMNQDDMQQQLQLLLNDQRKTAAGRRIAGITTTNTITTTYKDGGSPFVSRTSSRVSN